MGIFTPNQARQCLQELKQTDKQIMAYLYIDEEGWERSELVDRTYCQYIIGHSDLTNPEEQEVYGDWLYQASLVESDLPVEERGCTCELCIRCIPEAAVLFLKQIEMDVKIF